MLALHNVWWIFVVVLAFTENGIDKRIVCVTYGGTTALLEQRCVRYVDNFISGHRGATSTEYLFLHLLLFLFLSMKLFLGYLFGDLLEGNEYYVAGYVECRSFLKARYAVLHPLLVPLKKGRKRI
ncbi:hypothetical protein S83_051445 [Arachis hypogaea]